MSRAQQLMNEGRPYCFWLHQAGESQENPAGPDAPRLYRVSLVFQDETGHFPTGGGDVEPWFWDEATCKRMNQERLGLDEEAAFKIVASSMF